MRRRRSVVFAQSTTFSQSGTGAFSFEDLPAGEYSLMASSPGTHASVPLIVTLGSENGSVEGLRLTLQEAAYVELGHKQGRSSRERLPLEIWSEGSLLYRFTKRLPRKRPILLPPGPVRFHFASKKSGGQRRLEEVFESGELRQLWL